MRKINLVRIGLLSLAIIFFASSCDNDDNVIKGEFVNGVFISNEGNFGAGNGSISFYSVKGDSVSNNIFSKLNNRPLGDVVQSVKVFDNNAYIVVNASNKVEVVKYNDFVENGVITELSQPRYFAGISSDKAYVTQWG
ncbi:MAG: hypothetical protein U9R54_01010 [Bacteroidota bacterium]|nr:hypothetical protein [Bacteroidota bacterium]